MLFSESFLLSKFPHSNLPKAPAPQERFRGPEIARDRWVSYLHDECDYCVPVWSCVYNGLRGRNLHSQVISQEDPKRAVAQLKVEIVLGVTDRVRRYLL